MGAWRYEHTADELEPAAEQVVLLATGAGIDLEAVTAELEREGVQFFCASDRELLDCIERELRGPAPAGHRQ